VKGEQDAIQLNMIVCLNDHFGRGSNLIFSECHLGTGDICLRPALRARG
jgi:hypothetical protein